MGFWSKALLQIVLIALGGVVEIKSTSESPIFQDKEDLACLDIQVKFKPAGELLPSCFRLLSSAPCDTPDDWLVKDNTTGEGVCKPKPILQPCPQARIFRYTIYGDPVCICREGLLYVENMDACYPPYERGPCPEGEYLAFHEEEGSYEVKCTKKRCEANEIYADTSLIRQNVGSVYECINPANTTLCPKGQRIRIDNYSLKPKCAFVQRPTFAQPVIAAPSFSDAVPLIPCSEDQVRNHRGLCVTRYRSG